MAREWLGSGSGVAREWLGVAREWLGSGSGVAREWLGSGSGVARSGSGVARGGSGHLGGMVLVQREDCDNFVSFLDNFLIFVCVFIEISKISLKFNVQRAQGVFSHCGSVGGGWWWLVAKVVVVVVAPVAASLEALRGCKSRGGPGRAAECSSKSRFCGLGCVVRKHDPISHGARQILGNRV